MSPNQPKTTGFSLEESKSCGFKGGLRVLDAEEYLMPAANIKIWVVRVTAFVVESRGSLAALIRHLTEDSRNYSAITAGLIACFC